MGKVYYKDSFPIEIQLLDCQGEAIAIPCCDWQARIYTPDSNRFVVIRQKCSASGQPAMEGWKPSADGMRISAVLNNHGLHPGPLLAEINFDLSDDEMPDGKRRIRRHYDLGVYLSSDQCCCLPSAAEVEVVLPIIKGDTGPQGPKGDKGDAFTYADFTEAEIEALQRPAVEAAEKLGQFQTKAEASEAERNEAEKQRAEEFATWESVIESKADKSELSNVFASEPLTPENFPDINTYTREEMKMDLFIDMWNSAWGEYGKYDPANAPDVEHPFMGNKLWFTYGEALLIHRESSGPNYLTDYCHPNSNVKTFYPVNNSRGAWWNNAIRAFSGCPNLEVLRFVNSAYIGISPDSFLGSNRLRKILGGTLRITSTNALNLPLLEEVQIGSVNVDLNLSNAKELSKESFDYLITNAANTSAITITVHPDVYAKLTDESNTEWNQILTDAAAKNITFATV